MRRLAPLIAAVLACAAPFASASALYPVPRDERRIDLHLPGLAGGEEFHVQYTGFWHREDYARFRSRHLQAEVVYAAADPYENASLSVPLTFERARESFLVNAGGTRALGPVGRLVQGHRTLFFQPYVPARHDWACVSFKSEWDHVSRDPRNRPARVVFGYVCDLRGGAMDMARAEGMVRGLHTRGAEVDWHDNGPRLAGEVPIGTTRFPFKFGRHFNDHDGDNRK